MKGSQAPTAPPAVELTSPEVPQSNLGGGEGLEGIYGTLTRHYMQLVLDALEAHCGLAACSSLIDVGSGLGRSLSGLCQPLTASATLHGKATLLMGQARCMYACSSSSSRHLLCIIEV